MNVIKNLHWAVYNSVKQAIADLVRDQLSQDATTTGEFIALRPPVKVTCSLFSTGGRDQDLDNLSFVVKAALDAVVRLGYLPDDSVKYVKQVTYIYGGKDKMNPRHELLIEPYASSES